MAVRNGQAFLAGMNADLTVHKVGETQNGIIVRGGKMLATLGPFARKRRIPETANPPSG